MARLREFDTDKALDDAMQAFWLHGYEATSVADLMSATGLQKGSIYKAFKDKRNLFLLALQRYLDNINARHREYLESSDSPRESISAWLQVIIESSGQDSLRRGCFMLNSFVELAPHDPQVRQMLRAQFNFVESLLAEVIQHGQNLGEFRTDISARALSELVINLLHGLVTRSKGFSDMPELLAQAQTISQVLSPA